MRVTKPGWTAGVARRKITPPPGVELAGLGYYLERKWQRVRDDLNATALVISDETGARCAIVALDLMYNSAPLAATIRSRINARTGIPEASICINCSHTHNAPTAGHIRGAGEVDGEYLQSVAREAAAAAVAAFKNQRPVNLFSGHSELPGMTFNRARAGGPVDTRVGVLHVKSLDGRPIAAAVNFHSHCTAHMEVDLHAVSRDWPGEVVDQLEKALPGAIVMYLQGTCGDVNFKREFNGTPRRFEPARALAAAALQAIENARSVWTGGMQAASRKLLLPTRRWTFGEISKDREEGLHRLKTGDTAGWLDGIARTMVNLPARLPLRYGGSVEKAVAAVSRFAVEWADEMLPVFETLPESLEAEVQALRIGDVWLAANPSELFTSLGLNVRQNWSHDDLFMLGYSNGSIGYLPDAEEAKNRTYASIQSPKFMGQFPFTEKSGEVMVSALLDSLNAVST